MLRPMAVGDSMHGWKHQREVDDSGGE